jgi:geranylgeranyl reductase
MLKTEILIVGGGPAGATIAKYLSLAGIDNILIQRDLNFKKPCGGGIRVDAFDQFDLNKGLIQKYIDTITLISNNKKINVDIKNTPIGIVERREFDNYLRDEAQKHGSNIYEATFVNTKIVDNSVISTIKMDSKIQTITSTYLIAADGVNSKIRKQLNGDNVSSLLTNYADLTQFSTKNCEFHFGSKIADKYYAWIFPESGGANLGTLADRDESYMLNFLKPFNIKEKYRIKGYKIPEFNNQIFYKSKTFFVGDSASQVLPFTYEGIYYAMASAKLLADVIIEKKEPCEYQKRWEQEYLHRFKTLQKLQKIFLYNDFMIYVMMKLFESKTVQNQMIELWLGKKELKINFSFFIKVGSVQ